MRTRPDWISCDTCKDERQLLTAIVSRNQTDNRRPHPRQHKADPALVIVIDTARDGEDEIPLLLRYGMSDHCNARNNGTKQEIEQSISPALRLAWNPGCTVGIHDNGQATEDAHKCTWYGHIPASHDLDFDIAETLSVPPGASVVVGPEESIDDVKDIEKNRPADQTCGWQVAVFGMQHQRCSA